MYCKNNCVDDALIRIHCDSYNDTLDRHWLTAILVVTYQLVTNPDKVTTSDIYDDLAKRCICAQAVLRDYTLLIRTPLNLIPHSHYENGL